MRISSAGSLLVGLLLLAGVVVASFAPQSSAAIYDGRPVAAYSFDEGEGSIAEDAAGEHDGTVEGAGWTKGRYGRALEFDGEAGDLVTVPAAEDLQLEEFTVEAWVRPDKCGLLEPIVAKLSDEDFGYALYAGGDSNAGRPEGYILDGKDIDSHAGDDESLPLHAWSHIAVTNDGNKLRLYVNGELVDVGWSSDVKAGGEGPLTIGGNEAFEEGEYFSGKIDEVRIYERALGAGEVASDKGQPLQTSPTGPVAAYSFDEGEGSIAEDAAGEHDGTVEGAGWTKGRYGRALEFDGEAGDLVTVPAAEDLQLEEFTVEAWVRPDKCGLLEPIVAKLSDEDFGYALYAGGDSNAGRPEGYILDGKDIDSHAGDDESLPLHAWSHIAVTNDGNKLRLYVNGELVDVGWSSDVKAGGEGPLTIGGNEAFEEGEYFSGKIDEVKIYERALDAREIQPDVSPPTWPSYVEAVLEPEDEVTEISWSPSIDPAFADGHAGSGVKGYSYKYKVNGAPWSTWQATSGIAFEIPETEEGDTVRVTLFATDWAGNASPIRNAKVVSEATTVTPEDFGEEAVNETGDAPLNSEPAYFNDLFEEEEEEEENFARDAFEEKLCAANPSPCGKYNGRAAANYAIRWNLTDLGQEEARFQSNRNFEYFGGQGGDCTNYVSQALYNGGMRFMRAHGINDPNAIDPEVRSEFDKGPRSWWSYYNLVNNGPFAIRDYEVTESWVRAYKLRNQLLDTGMGKVVLPGERFKVGDIIFYDLHGINLANADHSQIVVAVGKRKVWVAQHSPGYIQTFRRVIRRNDTPDHKLHEDWTFQVVRPFYTAANIPE